MRPRTDGVGVPPLFSQGGGLTFDDCALFSYTIIWNYSNFQTFDFYTFSMCITGYAEASDGWWAHSGGEWQP